MYHLYHVKNGGEYHTFVSKIQEGSSTSDILNRLSLQMLSDSKTMGCIDAKLEE